MARAKRTFRNRQPRPHKAADDVYNARRRAKRLVARLEAEISENDLTNRARESYVQSLKEQIDKSYAENRSPQALAKSKKAAMKLDRMTSMPRANRMAKARSEAIFRQQLAAARRGDVSSIKEAEASVFYAATRHIWRNHDVKERNKLIIEKLEVSSLREAFEKVIAENKEAVKKYDEFSDAKTPDGERKGSESWESYATLFK